MISDASTLVKHTRLVGARGVESERRHLVFVDAGKASICGSTSP